MKRNLTSDDVRAAIWGGAILGGGGGGLIESGERAAKLALQVGTPQLWSIDEFDDSALTATMALVGAPAAPDPHVQPAHLLRTLELLRRELPAGQKLVGLHANENGAETTVNGWFHAAMSGLPVIDLACNGRAHPSSVMGALGLHTEPDYLSVQAYAGGEPHRYVEGVVSGRLEQTSAVVRRASVEAGGLVAVARNPVSVGYARRHGAPGAISHAIALGQTYLDGGVDAVARSLEGRIVAEGEVRTYRCEQQEGLDVGIVELDDAARTTLRFINEYMLLEQEGKRIARFPDLVMTFSDDGRPVVSAHVRQGARLRVLVAPRARLLLSRTMFMPELYRPLEKSLGEAFAPAEEALA
ncbi:DUF917 family protein [Variovorax sp. NFACC27]|uniref:S-methyl thiohydantoin desulfurase domain-containing protein n=1 Tax=unclassified Variovorax TaxID=663243 RepID=UPI00089AEFC7|nr:DUF917 family protein [Variovorax sp. YR750]MDP9603896.1 DUF917 family protein [Variovorax paradoxus]SEF26553.1 hypothetical protein SAMN03159371_02556 [Variovorax sp. NFACC28]SEG58683.1 hypothetical protein SAMN03159365_02636 [Variovorax sp. NFACC29]SFC57551.1 hypothetical protein SAMN03159379_02527 [Variovorax sp. NFACC26]SFG65943.1 hypothetical protein SAMN03159447_04275 [Variovorax sp. NFACC27]